MKFNYQARTRQGEVQMGTVEAASREGALLLLQRHGLYVTNLESLETLPFYIKKLELSKVKRKDLVVFSRQLSIMFKSKVPLVESLRTLAGQATKQVLKEKLLKISEKVEGGTSFSEALATFPETFDPFYINLVKSGEASGNLSESLNYLADHLEREYGLNAKVKGAMIYPVMILVMMVAITFLMSFYVLPQLTSMLEESTVELPFITKMVIWGANLVRSWVGIALLVAMGAGGFYAFRIAKAKEGKNKERMDKFLLRIPVLSNFLKMVYVSRFSENLSTLITGGLPISKALDISGSVVGHISYREAISYTNEEVKKGEKISTGLGKYPELFPPMFTTMVMVGEKTGTLGDTLMNIVVFYRMEVDRTLDNFLRILEPLLIMILGGGVGVLIASILMPLYETITTI